MNKDVNIEMLKNHTDNIQSVYDALEWWIITGRDKYRIHEIDDGFICKYRTPYSRDWDTFETIHRGSVQNALVFAHKHYTEKIDNLDAKE
jgi:hypothetical protein